MSLKYNIGNQKYDVYYLNSKFNQISKDLEDLKSDKKLLFLFDKNISKEIRNRVITSLKFSGCKIYQFEFIGTKNKSLKAVLKIIDFMISKGFTREIYYSKYGRRSVGRSVCFSCKFIHEGTIYFHIPTTMTSIVDSAIGGKTAVNYQNIINSIGTYFHANKVYILNDIIENLPDREFCSGLPEVLKCGLLKDKSIIKILKKIQRRLKKKSKYVKELCLKSLRTKIFFLKTI